MPGRYKVTGINPGDTGFQLGNCLTMRRSRDAVNTPGMYAKIRGSAMGWLNVSGKTEIDNLLFFDELFASDVVLDHVVLEPSQQGDSVEEGVLIAALLIAFPDARFGFGLPGGEDSLGPINHYRSIGKESVDLRDGSGDRGFLTSLFNYLKKNSYWVDDDLVHLLVLLTDICKDRDRTIHAQVLSLSTSGNHQIDAGLFHAYQVVEALLEIDDRESWRDPIAQWNDAYPLHQLNADEIIFIKALRDIHLHFKPERAVERLKASRTALGFDLNRSKESEFQRYGMQKRLREVAQAYFRARL